MLTNQFCGCGTFQHTTYELDLEHLCPNCTNELFLDEMAMGLMKLSYFEKLGWEQVRYVAVVDHVAQMKVSKC